MTAGSATFDDVRADSSPLEDGRYLLKVVRLEAAEEGQFGPSIRWVFNVADAASKAVMRDSIGDPYEFHQYSSTKLTPRSKAYPWIQAFLGRDIQVGESGAEIARSLVGTKAVAMIGPKDPGGRPVILSIKAFSSGSSPTTPAQAAAPATLEDPDF
jgi:hypothetical protein